jgi:hypothetical protein
LRVVMVHHLADREALEVVHSDTMDVRNAPTLLGRFIHPLSVRTETRWPRVRLMPLGRRQEVVLLTTALCGDSRTRRRGHAGARPVRPDEASELPRTLKALAEGCLGVASEESPTVWRRVAKSSRLITAADIPHHGETQGRFHTFFSGGPGLSKRRWIAPCVRTKCWFRPGLSTRRAPCI